MRAGGNRRLDLPFLPVHCMTFCAYIMSTESKIRGADVLPYIRHRVPSAATDYFAFGFTGGATGMGRILIVCLPLLVLIRAKTTGIGGS